MAASQPRLGVGSGPLKIGVFGTGVLGRHHSRLLSQLPGADLVGIFDARLEVAEGVAREFGCRAWPRFEDLADKIEAAVVATPTSSHAEIAGELLGRGIHVLVEKPISSTLAEAGEMIARASEAGRILAVGHVEYFNPAVQELLGETSATGTPPRFLEVQRLGVFSPRSLDVDVVLDLMIHDIQVLHALDPSPVTEVRATGIRVLSPKVDMANARIVLQSGCVANLTASRVSAERVRKLRAFLPRRYYSLDYQAQEIKGFRLEESEEKRSILPANVPVEKAEPLRRELEGFLAACASGAEDPPAVVSGRIGRQALATALAVGAAIEATS